ncbi:MAG: hypothetical protein LW721_03560 [Flammeovirgaceae bacterium]|jgi:hypothetical protein|nr:hypothetical protein [Flammeovirgaceae bacterium]
MTTEENYNNRIQEILSEGKGQTFGPFFAERVIYHIRVMQDQVEYQLFSFFKKYQLAAIGVVVALLVTNIILSETWSVSSILGLEKNLATDTVTDILQIDLYQDLIK